MVLHCNHAQEISAALKTTAGDVSCGGVTLLNQAVLLKGVNDDVASQVNLSEALFATHVLPYYLHLLDKVEGAQHFDVPEALHWR